MDPMSSNRIMRLMWILFVTAPFYLAAVLLLGLQAFIWIFNPDWR